MYKDSLYFLFCPRSKFGAGFDAKKKQKKSRLHKKAKNLNACLK